jgi:hypothetical protein
MPEVASVAIQVSSRCDSTARMCADLFKCQGIKYRAKRRQLKACLCLAPSFRGEAICMSGTACCSTSSSSVLWWITHVRSGGPLPAATYGSCRYYNPSVFALRLTHLGTLATRGFGDSIFRRSHDSTDRNFQLKVSWCGEPLNSATWKALGPTEGCLKLLTGSRSELMLSRPAEAVPQKDSPVVAMSSLYVVSYPDWGLPCFPQLLGKFWVQLERSMAPPLPQSCGSSAKVNSPPPPEV